MVHIRQHKRSPDKYSLAEPRGIANHDKAQAKWGCALSNEKSPTGLAGGPGSRCHHSEQAKRCRSEIPVHPR
jgi:hypothetical protein